MHARIALGLSVVLSTGCGIRPCDRLCQADADCVQAEIAAHEATWEEWTGFPDRETYVDECFAVFDESRRSSSDARARKRLKKLCRAELDQGCGP